jgi:hypothetical protein
MPLGYEVFASNRADVTTMQEIVETLESRYGRANRIWAMDRGMISEDNIAFMKSEGRRYIVRTPKQNLKQYERELLADNWELIREGLEVKQVASPSGDETFIICRSAERRAKEQAIHERFEKRIDEGLACIAAGCAKRQHKVSVIERRVGRLLGKSSRAAGLFTIRPEARSDLAPKSTTRRGPHPGLLFSLRVVEDAEPMVQRAGLGDEPRKVLDELSQIKLVDVVLPTRQSPPHRSPGHPTASDGSTFT